jgi:DNA-binding IclR family transcriptional regulator
MSTLAPHPHSHKPDTTAKPTTGVAAVERALAILDAFTEGNQALPLAELSRRTGLYKSTLLRLAHTLIQRGYLRRLADGSFCLGPALLKLGTLYQQSFDLGRFVTPVLTRLAATTGESASLYVREGDKRTCLFRVHSHVHHVLHYVTPGTQLPLDTGATGEVIRAFTEPIPANEQQHKVLVVSARDRKGDTAALAAPIFGVQGFVGALSLAGPRSRFDDATVRHLSLVILDAALELTRALGGDGRLLEEALARHQRPQASPL